MRTPLLLAGVGASLLTGCATSPFAQSYQTYTNQWSVAEQKRLLPPSGTPQIVSSSNIRADGRRLQEQGLLPIGFATFRGPPADQQQLRDLAKKVGAEVVLYTSQYSHTVQGVTPLVSYQPGQTYTTQSYGTATASAYGTGGYAYGDGTYFGTSTTTTPGTYSTQYVPYQLQIFDQGAVFWQRMRPDALGANLAPIPEAMRTSLQRNTGALVDIVIQDTAAFRANILEGDIVIQIADKPVETVQQLVDLLPSYAGQKVILKVIRGSQTLDVNVQLAEPLKENYRIR